MGSRTKEAIFDLLRGWFDGTRVLDLYSGVGTMGLEALSRGSASAVLVEKDRRVLSCLRTNVAALGCVERVTVLPVDVLAAELLEKATGPFDVVFCDPPFDAVRRSTARAKILARLDSLGSIMAPKSFLVLRVPDLPDERTPMLLPQFDGPEIHSYGNEQHVLLFAPKRGAIVPTVPDEIVDDVPPLL